MYRVGEDHGRCGNPTCKRTPQFGIRPGMGIQGEQLRDPDTDNACKNLTYDRIAGLREGRVDGAEFKDCSGTLFKN